MSELVTRFTSLPNLHPALVHFPIALLPVAILLDLLTLRLPRQREWPDRAATVLYVAAAAGSIAAYWAGRLAAEGLPPLALHIQLHVNEHSDSARVATWLVGLVAAARVAVAARDTRFRRKVLRIFLISIALASVALIYRTADLGGGLVYQHRVGVAEIDQHGEDRASAAEPETTDAIVAGAASRLSETGNGKLIWKPLPTDREAIGAVLSPAPGTDASAISWVEPADGERGLGLAVDGEAVLLLPGAFGDVEVMAELEAEGFEGEMGVAHHVSSGAEAGLLTLSFPGGQVALVSRSGGESRTLATAVRSISAGPFQLRVTAAGRHFYGFLGEERVVHGHEPPPRDGGCGLFLRGKGTVRVLSLTITPARG